jgi:transcriptional regulator with XRE-family HTH domain
MQKESWKKIGVRLKRLRRINRMTQDDVAEALELKSTARISRWENGEQMPGDTNKMRLCSLYKILFDELFYELRQEAVEAIERYHQKVQMREQAPPGSS